MAELLRTCCDQITPSGSPTKPHPSANCSHQWVQTALWGFAVVGILVGYLPPKRTFENSSTKDRLRQIDWIGSAILTAAITLFVAGLNFVSVYQWGTRQVLGPLIAGVVAFVAFGLYESFGTKRGIIPHELFQGGGRFGWSFALFCILFFIEGLTFFAIVTFYPTL